MFFVKLLSTQINKKEECFTIYEKALFECSTLEEKIKNLDSRIQQLPSGKLVHSGNGSRRKYYISQNHSKTYIPKAKQQLLEELTLKKYLSNLREDYSNELTAINSYLKIHKPFSANELLENDADCRKILSNYFTPNSKIIQTWLQEPFIQSTEHKENLIHRCISGDIVRSKSEEIIANLLHNHQIPFRYECKLEIDDMIFYPDFTIMHPKTFKIYYWEHFGMIDIPKYSKNAFSKLNIYSTNGIVPSINLITTFETSKIPLTSDVVEQVINTYFL